ncbi:hypothetical protein ABZ234_08675 [Nocardiopsis sp. NPDC006198]|uniref:hypothetical protein n=1 Tax=Nocardiopsis sp. NPDC006198 TaxID=3154472 RepID=UPI0033B69145
MNTDNIETVASYTEDGLTYEIDHLGITHPTQRGEYAVYLDGRQVAEFLAWGTFLVPEAQPEELPPPGDLIDMARRAVRDQD